VDQVSDSVTLKLFGGLEERSRERRAQLAINAADAPSVAALIAGADLALGAVGLILVNGLHAGPQTPVVAGDTVALFPPVGGG